MDEKILSIIKDMAGDNYHIETFENGTSDIDIEIGDRRFYTSDMGNSVYLYEIRMDMYESDIYEKVGTYHSTLSALRKIREVISDEE